MTQLTLFSCRGILYDVGKNEQKSEEHLDYNPNGRVPTLIDHQNNGYAIWESAAILAYLTDKQGAIWGQAGWLNFFHPEPVASAVTRYRNETKRVLGVLERILQNKDYLVTDKYTIADMSFINWNDLLPPLFGKGRHEFKEDLPQLDFEKEFSKTYAWHQSLTERPAVAAILKEWEQSRQQ
ncbi:glutathione S-transferase Gst2 [Schizosaccharomyces cryophilus OY26]|uniref:Glutathione S-transferase Gst2 n=1 Tax=Schizosaccharomyces cryophilus (strain OY26 / ATCC MYA-4695 / CBS 11777 / NBRC 106824 / NRRL Y48691) TaxID=653667 RepID=S9X5T6_SCHCR|nr:glutathione S-transferase Gst2 [Schizosaccharomyces cryophilus OY26]EPY49156.1 glutathione S-transferase Gst2 [Schizosaccharomyces cryophilus OY26]